jgi:acetyl esterase/lipase
MTNLLKTLLAVALVFPSLTMAQDVIILWPDGAIPNAIPGANIPEKSETGTDGILRISQVSVPTLTVYRPAKQTANAAVMICPGGGYWILASGHEGADMARWFNELGITAFVLKYRLPDDRIMTTPHEVPLMDAMQGMKLIRQNAAKYGLNPEKLGVMGFSAGGHLASTLSTHYWRGPKADETAKPNFAILLYPVITFGPKAHSGSREKLLGKNAPADLIAYYSNELQVTEKTPPTLLVHSIDDGAVPAENSIDYALALKQHKISAEMHLYPTGGHGYGLRTAGKGSVANWPEACKGWLKAMGLTQ